MRIADENLKNYGEVFVFNEYRDRTGSGSQEYFDNPKEAINYAKKEWEHLADSDKKSYLKDPAGFFMVTKNTVTKEEDPSFELLNVLWDALSPKED